MYYVKYLYGTRPHYGYEIISRLEEWPILAAKESTIYPLLRRLLKDGFLTSYRQETTEGLPPRKYYEISEAGCEYLQAMSAEWDTLCHAITSLKPL